MTFHQDPPTSNQTNQSSKISPTSPTSPISSISKNTTKPITEQDLTYTSYTSNKDKNNYNSFQFPLKKNRTELRAFKEAFPIKLVNPDDIKYNRNNLLNYTKIKRFKRCTSYCVAKQLNLKLLLKHTRSDPIFAKSTIYYNECLETSVRFDINNITDTNNIIDTNNIGNIGNTDNVNNIGNIMDGLEYSDIENKIDINHTIRENVMEEQKFSSVFFFEYGVIVTWGLNESQESYIIKLCYEFSMRPYPIEMIQSENFLYGLLNNQNNNKTNINENILDNKNELDNKNISHSYFCNDVFYLQNDSNINKMVISSALAQSIKLDYFEVLIEETIHNVAELPHNLSLYGSLRLTPKQIKSLIGKLYVLKFDLNLVSNILDDPEILWYYAEYEELYENIKICMEIKQRADLLNKRVDTIKELLIINNSINDKYESNWNVKNKSIIRLLSGSTLNTITNIFLIAVLLVLIFILFLNIKNNNK